MIANKVVHVAMGKNEAAGAGIGVDRSIRLIVLSLI